jgi:hypothetical protein
MLMLRVSYSDNDAVQRWCLCGHLAGPWVDELRSCWQHARRLAPRSRAVVDLRDVTFVDEAGERLLCEMQNGGTEFEAAGVENKDLLASLQETGTRPLRRLVEHLAPCGMPKTTEGGEE